MSPISKVQAGNEEAALLFGFSGLQQTVRAGCAQQVCLVCFRWEDFRDRRGDWGRELALYLGGQKGGMSLRELCEAAGASTLMAMSLAIRRFGNRLSSEESLIKAMRQASKKLET